MKNSRFIFRNFFLILSSILLISSCQPKTQKLDLALLEVNWRLIKNFIDDSPKAECQLIFKNNGQTVITHENWSLDFTQIMFFEQSIGDTTIGVINHVNGYLNRFIPGSKFKIQPGDSLIYNYVSPSPIIKASYAPAGAYIVTDGKAIEIRDIQITGFDDLAKVFPDTTVYKTVPNADNTFDKYQKIHSFGTDEEKCPIVPTPLSYQPNGQSYVFGENSIISFDAIFESEAQYLQDFLKNQLTLNTKIQIKNGNTSGGINLVLNPKIEGKEAYEISAFNSGITISASTNTGIFYGIQSTIQLISASQFANPTKEVTIQGALVKDNPRFAYRGFLLDVGRNFQSKQSVLKLIDLLAQYKINKLNLRLTEDEGWRIEIPELPELTSVGSKRGHTLNSKDHLQPAFGSGPFPSTEKAYYSKQDFIDIIKYGTKRHVEIIPEICFPSHARAAIMAMESRYDKFMKEGKKEKAEEFRLIDPDDKSKYRSAQCFRDNIVSVARPSTYHFYETVVKSLVQMYDAAGTKMLTFNTGGDEVPFGAWSESPMAKELMKTKPEITNPIQLQGYFLEKTLDILAKYNLQITGWEEIVLNKDPKGKAIINPKFINKNVLPLVWDNTGDNIDLGYRIANAGYPVVLCNVTSLYFDLSYDTDPFENGLYWGGFTDNIDPFLTAPFDGYKTTNYNFWGQMLDVTPSFPGKQNLNSNAVKNIVGLQAQLWSETITGGEEEMQYFTLPKLFGFAEKAWSKGSDWEIEPNTQKRTALVYRDWSNLTNVIGRHHLPRLNYLFGGFKYRVSPPGVKVVDGKIKMNTEFPNLTIRFTTNGTTPDKNSANLKENTPLTTNIKVRAFDERGNGSKVFDIKK